MDGHLSKVSEGPDLTANRSIQMFTSPFCSDNLRQHYHKRRMSVGDRAPHWVKSLPEKLWPLVSS